MRQRRVAMVALGMSMIATLISGCGGANSTSGQKPTFKVVGLVTIDGDVPKSPLQIVCYPREANADSSSAVRPSCTTKIDGSFACTTYRDGDGAPAGDYSLVITWQDVDQVTRKVKTKDKLNGRYSDPKKSEIHFTVTNKTVELGTIELTSN
ncbi:hypothetical protein [Schlesneria paludicola]|uniref:hypothetical protein n=1 Tax=Schlesneria paludicola TaxID=360056 RepID=UPI000299DC8E|nr:hypothetical protein [Schlesneria paludicola]